MKPLDAVQQRELEFLRAQRRAEQQLGADRRWALVGALVVGPALVVGLIGLAAGELWLGLGLGLLSGVAMLAVQAPRVLWPDKAAEWAVRASMPTAKSMRRGDRNRSWPG